MAKKSFGTTIKMLRKKHKLTQKMLAQDICSQGVLSRIENDVEMPNVVVLNRLCDRLGVTMDQVMQLHVDDIHKHREIFSSVHTLFIQQEHQQVEDIIRESEVLDYLYSDTDLQQYYYYVGSCEFYLHKNYNEALIALRQGLAYTYQTDKRLVSSVEIQMISCIGRVYAAMGDFDEAKQHLQKALDLLLALPKERTTFELTKVFFNYSYVLFELGMYSDSLAIVQKGVAWSNEYNSHYFLEDLFLLASENCVRLNDPGKAAHYMKLSNYVKEIRQI